MFDNFYIIQWDAVDIIKHHAASSLNLKNLWKKVLYRDENLREKMNFKAFS